MPYKDTFITVAEDCPVLQSEEPVSKRAKRPGHLVQYEMVMAAPYKYGHKDLIWATYLNKEELSDLTSMEEEMHREKLFSKGHPCLRASALTKRYGYGAHYNTEGKIALIPMETEEYQAFLKDDSVKKVPAMRRSRK